MASPIKYELIPRNSNGLRDDLSSLLVIGYITFIGDAARGVLFPALWPLCQQLGGSKVDLGWLVAIFSIGRMIVATPLGKLTDTYRHKRVLFCASVILMFGSILWSSVEFIGGLPSLYFAQFLLGVGSGTLGVTRAYVVEQTSPQKRTFMLARLSALQYAGFAATPIAGSALVAAGKSIGSKWTYALPAFLVLFLTSLGCISLLVFFKDYQSDDAIHIDPPLFLASNPVKQEETPSFTPNNDVECLIANNEVTNTEAVDTNFASIYMLLMGLNFTTRGGIAVFEAQASQILLDQYQFPQIFIGVVVSAAGIIGTVNLIFFKQFWTKNFSDMHLMLGGIGLMALVQISVVNWSPTEPTIVWRFLIPLVIVYGVAYPVGNSSVLGLFSMLQKKGRQAKAQGTFALMGSAARVLLPILSGYLETYGYPTSSFSLVMIMMSLSVVSIICLYWKIVFYSSGGVDKNAPLNCYLYSLGVFFCGTAVAGLLGMLTSHLNFPGY